MGNISCAYHHTTTLKTISSELRTGLTLLMLQMASQIILQLNIYFLFENAFLTLDMTAHY